MANPMNLGFLGPYVFLFTRATTPKPIIIRKSMTLRIGDIPLTLPSPLSVCKLDLLP